LDSDGQDVYFVDASDSSIRRAPVSGGAVSTLATAQLGPKDIVVDASHVYWTNSLGGTVHRVPKIGGAVEVVASATGQPSKIAEAGNLVYFIAGAALFSVPKSLGAIPSQLSTPSVPFDLTADADGAWLADYDKGIELYAPGAPVKTYPGYYWWLSDIATDSDRIFFRWAEGSGLTPAFVGRIDKLSGKQENSFWAHDGGGIGQWKEQFWSLASDGAHVYAMSNCSADGSCVLSYTNKPTLRRLPVCDEGHGADIVDGSVKAYNAESPLLVFSLGSEIRVLQK
jgi:hypothetical protein